MIHLGVQELFVILVMLATSLLPLAALVWALVTMHRIRATQLDMQRQLDLIERSLHQPPA